jgi:hypothetical protein
MPFRKARKIKEGRFAGWELAANVEGELYKDVGLTPETPELHANGCVCSAPSPIAF